MEFKHSIQFSIEPLASFTNVCCFRYFYEINPKENSNMQKENESWGEDKFGEGGELFVIWVSRGGMKGSYCSTVKGGYDTQLKEGTSQSQVVSGVANTPPSV